MAQLLHPAALGLAASVFYGVAFIAHNSLVQEGTRFFPLLDDAMISMRYAKNLVDGHGLVWNPGGERVEGFTNPLWVAVMALLHLAPARLPTISLLVQVVSLAALAFNLVLVWRIADNLGASRAATALAIVFTGLYLPLNTWALLGMEVGLVAVVLSAGTLGALQALKSNRLYTWPSLVLAAGTLVRMDTVVAWVALTASLAWLQPRFRKQHLRMNGLLAVAVLGAQTLARRAYYGEWLPNTYYLKVGGVGLLDRVAAGSSGLFTFFVEFSPLLAALAAVAALTTGSPGRRLLLTVVAAQLAYDVYVGGDMAEWWQGANRFVASSVSLVFILVALALDDYLLRPLSAILSMWARHITVALFAFAVVVDVNSFNRGTLEVWALRAPALQMDEAQEVLASARLVAELTEPTARVAVVWAGTVPYFASRPAVDLLGKNDKVIAHQPLASTPADLKGQSFWPGHMKWNYARSIGELEPDVITQLWSLPNPRRYLTLSAVPAEAVDYLKDLYIRAEFDGRVILVRKDSPRIHWEDLRRRATRIAHLR